MKVFFISLVLCLTSGLLHAATPADDSSAPATVEQSAAASHDEKEQVELAATQEAVQREAEASEDPMTEQEVSTLEAPEPSEVKK